jgi:exodeoxyribonuclease (lambda-induced)
MDDIEQGSEKWLQLKLGVISASNISKVLAKKGTETRNGYMTELIGQIATKSTEQIDGQALRWGRENEIPARSAYEMITGRDVEQVSFIYSSDKRLGVSPDGLCNGRTRGLEIKNPFTTKVHIDFLLNDKIKLEYIYQVQFSLYVTRLEAWDFCSYDKRMMKNQMKIVELTPDLKLFERFDNDIGEFILEMDKALSKIDLVYGEQWKSN